MERVNPYAPPRAENLGTKQSHRNQTFGAGLTTALMLPAVVAVTGWFLPLLSQTRVSMTITGVAVVIGTLSEIVPVAIAIAKLTRKPCLRTTKNVVLTGLGAAVLVPLLVVVFISMVGVKR